MPVATGERIHTLHEYRELFELHAADIIQPDIAHFGGILHTKKLAAWADTYYVLIAPHNVGGPVATAAALHLAAGTPNFKIQENFNDFDEAYVLASAPVVATRAQIAHGAISANPIMRHVTTDGVLL